MFSLVRPVSCINVDSPRRRFKRITAKLRHVYVYIYYVNPRKKSQRECFSQFFFLNQSKDMMRKKKINNIETQRFQYSIDWSVVNNHMTLYELWYRDFITHHPQFLDRRIFRSKHNRRSLTKRRGRERLRMASFSFTSYMQGTSLVSKIYPPLRRDVDIPLCATTIVSILSSTKTVYYDISLEKRRRP